MEDVMRRFVLWYGEGEYTPTGTCFDVGGTCSSAIEAYLRGTEAENCGARGECSIGNGALMRIYPFVLSHWLAPLENWEEGIDRATALTHAHPRALLTSRIYALVLLALLKEPAKDAVREALREAKRRYGGLGEWKHFDRICSPCFPDLPEEEIVSSGYAVATLEAALWCLFTADSYRAAVEKAVNLGGDTDTVAAVTGSLAGALWGVAAIPRAWMRDLLAGERIDRILSRFAKAHE